MVAVPKSERYLEHLSEPLMQQMHNEIDRTRWPVLITYHDEGQGHNGYVYQCAGWTKTLKSKQPVFESADGIRAFRGATSDEDVLEVGTTTLQRWEHWACEPGEADVHMDNAGWVRVPIPGKTWKSGNQAYTYVRLFD